MSTPPKAVLNPGACGDEELSVHLHLLVLFPFFFALFLTFSGPSHYFLIISSLLHNSLFLCSFQYPECFSAQSAQLEHTFITFIISAFSQHIKLLSFTWMFLLLCQLCRFNGGLFLKPPPNLHPPLFIYQPSILSVR